MRKLAKYAAALTMTGALAVAAAAPSEARPWHHWHNGAAIGAGIAAGVLAGAAVATANDGYYYGPDYAYDPGYAYEPGYAYDYAPGPAYYGPSYYRSGSNWNSRSCTISPGSTGYVPCNNQ
jgi:hypothetical protein